METKVEFNSKGDTVRIDKYYLNGKIKESIFYKENHPDSNVAFRINGDTVTWSNVLISEDSSEFFVYLPIRHFEVGTIVIASFPGIHLYLPDDTLYYNNIKNDDVISLNFMTKTKIVKGIIVGHDKITGSVDLMPFRQRWDGQQFEPIKIDERTNGEDPFGVKN